MKSKKDTLIKMCDQLEELKNNNCLFKNDISEARGIVMEYVGNDHDKYLQLCAEVKDHQNFGEKSQQSLSVLIASLSFMVSAFCLLNLRAMVAVWTVALLFVACLIVMLIQIVCEKTYRSRWINVIDVVLQDIGD